MHFDKSIYTSSAAYFLLIPLDVQGRLVLGGQHKDRENVSVAREAGVPVLLVAAAEDEVEGDEEQRHARSGPDADVEGGVVTKIYLGCNS